MFSAVIRDSLVGKIVHSASGRKVLCHREDQPDYVIPEKYLVGGSSETSIGVKHSDDCEGCNVCHATHGIVTDIAELNKTNPQLIVEWDDDHDTEDPLRWPSRIKIPFLLMVGLLTTTIYMGSAIHTPGINQVMETYNVGQVTATLPMSMYVLGYGIGPMIFSPLSEHPPVGKRHIYLATLLIFVLLQIPTALSKHMNIQALIALRFFGGFAASPALATGAASVGDVVVPSRLPAGLASWGISGHAAPVLAPLFGSIFTHFLDVFWTFWFLMIISGFMLIILVCFMPETSQSTLLYRKAKRLRRITGNPNIVSQGELDMQRRTWKQLIAEILVEPFKVAIEEPMVMSVNIYVSLNYAIYYSFFESFPLVFKQLYNFTMIEEGVSFLAIAIGVVMGCSIYIAVMWQRYTIPMARGEFLSPEVFMPPAIVASIAIPTGLFIFGWSATKTAHWIGPMIGSALFASGAFVIFQTLFNYLAFSFPRYMASVFASNGLFRSVFACVFPLFVTIMYKSLGPEKFPVGWGCTILAIASMLMIPIPITFYFYGPKLRGKSKFAN